MLNLELCIYAASPTPISCPYESTETLRANPRQLYSLATHLSPADGIQGLRIHRFEVSPAAGPREFKLALTLIQAMRHESLASGLVQIALAGLTANRPARHTVGELLGRPRAQLPFSFRYFQTIEQNVTLPTDFEPLEVEIEVRSSKLKSPVRQNFPWKLPAPPPL